MSVEVRVERHGNRILVGSAIPIPGIKDSIPGAYFRKDGTWSVPLDLTTCHLLRERYGKRLSIGPSLTAWARAEKATRARAADLAAAADAELFLLPKVAPDLYAATNSRTYQRSGIRFIVDARGRDDRRRALLADTVGLGKTAQAIAAMLESGEPGPYLIVCPKTPVLSTWVPEIRKWLGDSANVVALPEGKAEREKTLNSLLEVYRRGQRAGADPAMKYALSNTWIVVHPYAVRTQTWWECGEYDDLAKATCNYRTKYKAGMVQELDCGHRKTRNTAVIQEHNFPQLFEMEYGGLVADESDQMLIRKTATPNLQRRGMEMLRDLVRPGGIRLAMSGTPFRSKPQQMWSTLNWLDPVRWSAKWAFLERYWPVKKGGYGGSYSVDADVIPEREPLLLDELNDVMIRRTRDMVRGDLPPKDYPSNVRPEDGLTPGIYLPMTAAQEKAYRSIENTGEASIEGGTLTTIGILAEMTRMKQFAGAPGFIDARGEFHPKAEGNKYEWILEFLEELGFPDRPATKLVIASQFTQLLNAFAEGVAKEFKGKIGSAMLTGESGSGARRAETVSRFEDPDSGLDLFWINTKAGGSSITLDAAEVMVVLDETYVADEQEQLEGRIDNRQPERRIVPRSYYYLRSSDTIEEGIARANAAAKARGERILNGAALARQAKEIMSR